MTKSQLSFRRAQATDPDAAALAAAHVEEGAHIYGDRGPRPQRALAPLSEILGPADRVLVAYAGSVPVACGAVRALEPEVGEIKRMYVVPTARGQGVGRALLRRLESEATAMGFDRVRLDTGDRQLAAVALYRSAGYREIADYNRNPAAAHWFEKALGAANGA